MQQIKSTLPQPRYVPEEQVKGQPNEHSLLVQGQLRGCNYAVICKGPYPIAMIEVPCDPSTLPEISPRGITSSIGRFVDATWMSTVEVSKTGDSVIIGYAFNKNGDYSVTDAKSDIPEVRELNEKKQKWTTEAILNEILTAIGGFIGL